MAVVNFNMVVEINMLLKEKGIEYSVHADGGCTCAGLTLRKDGQEYDQSTIIQIINDYLYPRFMEVIVDEDNPNKLNVASRFEL